MNTLSFRTIPQSIPVSLEGPEGVKTELQLVEMNAADRDTYLDMLSTRVKTDAAGVASVKKFDGLQSELLIRSLVKSDGTKVTAKEVQAWPSSTVDSLFTAAQEINHLTKKQAEATEKNA